MVSPRYEITVYIAEIASPTLKMDGSKGSPSMVGHAWVGLKDNQRGLIENYGLHPSIDGENNLPGEIRTSDYFTYKVETNPEIKQYNFQLTEWEYNRIRDYCENARVSPPWYDAIHESDCIYWVYEVLKYAAIITIEDAKPSEFPGNNESKIEQLKRLWKSYLAKPSEFPGNNESKIEQLERWWKSYHEIPLSDYCRGDGTEKDFIGIVSQELLLGDKNAHKDMNNLFGIDNKYSFEQYYSNDQDGIIQLMQSYKSNDEKKDLLNKQIRYLSDNYQKSIKNSAIIDIEYLFAPNDPVFADATLSFQDMLCGYHLEYNEYGVKCKTTSSGQMQTDDLFNYWKLQEYYKNLF